jgi:hypothetical protein
METASFNVEQQDFQALRLNESNHSSISPFGFFQDAHQVGVFYEEHSRPMALESYIAGGAFGDNVAKNRFPVVRFDARPRFKQRTFAGKPLSDDEIVHATQIASELEDEIFLRRMLGR